MNVDLGWQLHPHAPWLAANGVACLVLAAWGLRRLDRLQRRTFSAMLFGCAAWSFGAALAQAGTTYHAKALGLAVEYLGVVTTPTAFVLLALGLAGHHDWLDGRRLRWLAVVPALALAAVLTNPWHHLYWAERQLYVDDGLVRWTRDYRPLFWIYTLYSYGLLVVGTDLLIHALARAQRLTRQQAASVLTAAVLPWAANAAYVGGLSSFDATPMALTLSVLAIAWGILRFGGLELVPVARDAVIEVMPDAVVVLDPEGRVTDLNPAARRLFGTSSLEAIGRPAGELFGEWPSFEPLRPGTSELLGAGWPRRAIEARVAAFTSGNQRAYLVIASDITRRKEAEDALELANQELGRQARTDPLTELGNRRAFDERLDAEERRAGRTGLPLSLLLADVDFFKAYNDRYGHEAGDECLRAIARCLVAVARRAGDFAARYGGEELAVLLPLTDAAAARAVAEEIRQAVAAIGIPHAASSVADRVTVSIGVATSGPAAGGASVLSAADAALYAAKHAGRNRVLLADDQPKRSR